MFIDGQIMFRRALRKFNQFSSEPWQSLDESKDIESAVYGYATGMVVSALNKDKASYWSPRERVAQVLERVERASALPYCWFSAIDTWDNPSLCAVDTYNLSGDSIKLVASAYNRPDLVPIAKALQYARRGDYAGTLDYCASGEVARRFIRETPDFLAFEIQVKKVGDGKEQIYLGSGEGYAFDVEESGGRWRLVDFREIDTKE